MRSLTAKLMFAFLLTSVAGVALAAVFIRRLVVSEFDDYVLAQRRDAFVEAARSYYAANGSWDGVAAWLREQEHAPPHAYGAAQAEAAPGKRQDDGAAWPSFELADASGVVVFAVDPARRGLALPAAELVGGVPIMADGRLAGTVITLRRGAYRNPAEEQYLRRTDWALTAAAGVVVGMALVLGIVLARLITRPVRELTIAARAIAAGDLRQRVPVRSRDELGLLADQFNRMSSDLDRANRLRRQLTADIAHDLRTPLTVIAGYLESLRDQVLRPTPERFATMYAETQVLLRLVDDLHTLSLAESGSLPLARQPVPAEGLLERVAATYRDVAAQAGVTLCVERRAAGEISVDVEQMARVLGNLVSNALRHTPAKGRVTLSARGTPGGVELSVADTGGGIPPEHLPNVFERFYRADPSRQEMTGGSGLGLAIVRSLVEAHGGAVRAESVLGQGTTVTIVLPFAR